MTTPDMDRADLTNASLGVHQVRCGSGISGCCYPRCCLQTLFDHQEQQPFVYEQVWRPGDILMWDNCCTLHARTDFSAGERRLLRRVTILGEKPV